MAYTEVWDIPGYPKITMTVDASGNEISTVFENPPTKFIDDIADEIYTKWHDLFGPECAPIPSRIVLYGLSVVLILQQFAGCALPLGASACKESPTYPEDGAFFTESAQCVGQVNALLQQAASAGWQGLSANSYSTANAVCAELARAIADSDREMERLVKRQAECVTRTQLGLGIEQDTLIPTYASVLFLEKDPTTLNMALVLAVSAVSAALIAAVALLINCVAESDNNAKAANSVDYSSIARTARGLIATQRTSILDLTGRQT